MTPILPGAMLGVLGGGQLGRMFTIAARRMGYHVTVLDPDLSGAPLVTVRISSTTESAGEALVLRRAAGLGIFTNRIATATGSGRTDGLLQVAHNDTITVKYDDASAGASRASSLARPSARSSSLGWRRSSPWWIGRSAGRGTGNTARRAWW